MGGGGEIKLGNAGEDVFFLDISNSADNRLISIKWRQHQEAAEM